MKKQDPQHGKLKLSLDTLRVLMLSNEQLARVAGGGADKSTRPTGP
jgi:hypothetical protein